MKIERVRAGCVLSLNFDYCSVKVEREYEATLGETDSPTECGEKLFEMAHASVQADVGVMRRSNPVEAAIIEGASRKLVKTLRMMPPAGGAGSSGRPPDPDTDRPPPPPPPAPPPVAGARAARRSRPRSATTTPPPTDFDGFTAPPPSGGGEPRSETVCVPDPEFLRD